jgi:pyruvate formate lyase activating enzyme
LLGRDKYEFLGEVYELKDFTSPTPEMLKQYRNMIDEAFGRKETDPVKQ